MRSMSTLSRLGEDIWVSTLKSGLQASPAGPASYWGGRSSPAGKKETRLTSIAWGTVGNQCGYVPT